MQNTTARRLMAASKLSDYTIARIIRFYADAIPAAEAARRMRVSYVTIGAVYNATRQRMLELTLYQTLDSYLKSMNFYDEDTGRFLGDEPLLRYLNAELAKRRGVTSETKGLHTAELIFRFERAKEPRAYQTSHYVEIMKLIRLSGPLNREVSHEGREKAHGYLVQRLHDQDARAKREYRQIHFPVDDVELEIDISEDPDEPA